MWDDGRPLICYTQDALNGLVRFALKGTVGTITLRENEIRTAIKETLSSGEVVDTFLRAFLERAKDESDRKFTDTIRAASKGT